MGHWSLGAPPRGRRWLGRGFSPQSTQLWRSTRLSVYVYICIWFPVFNLLFGSGVCRVVCSYAQGLVLWPQLVRYWYRIRNRSHRILLTEPFLSRVLHLTREEAWSAWLESFTASACLLKVNVISLMEPQSHSYLHTSVCPCTAAFEMTKFHLGLTICDLP